MNSTTSSILTAAALFLAVPASAQNQKGAMKEERPGLLQRAKITPSAATAAAQARVPKGRIQTAEIEEENGKLIFSFDMKTKGKTGIDEVAVDAMSGQVLSVQHETPKDEAREGAADVGSPKVRL